MSFDSQGATPKHSRTIFFAFFAMALAVVLAGCQSPSTATSTSAPTYGVLYNGNGFTGGAVPVDNGHYQAGASATVLDNTGNLTKGTAVGFSGWNTSPTGNGTAYAHGSKVPVVSGDVNLYAVWAAPAITSISATSGSPGTVITVTGTGFSLILTNDFIGIIGYSGHTAGTGTLNPTAATSTSMTFTVPLSILSGSGYTVGGNIDYDGSTPANLGGSVPTFNVLAPTITSISPTSGSPGTVVTVTGTGFSTTLTNDFIGIIGYSGHTAGTGTLNPAAATSTSMTFTVPLSILSGSGYTVGGNIDYDGSTPTNLGGSVPSFTVN